MPLDRQNVPAEVAFQRRCAAALPPVAPTADSIIRRYRENRGWRRFPKEFVFRRILELAPRHICEIGCGDGVESVELGALGFRVTGFDVSPEQIARARERARLDHVQDRVDFVVGDILARPTGARRFDMVLAIGVLHHVALAPALAEIHALLEPGGHAIFKEPVALSPLLRWLRDRVPVPLDISPNERQLQAAELIAIADSLEIVERRSFHLLGRLARLVPESQPALQGRAADLLTRLDALLLAGCPLLNRFAGLLVLVCRRPDKPSFSACFINPPRRTGSLFHLIRQTPDCNPVLNHAPKRLEKHTQFSQLLEMRILNA